MSLWSCRLPRVSMLMLVGCSVLSFATERANAQSVDTPCHHKCHLKSVACFKSGPRPDVSRCSRAEYDCFRLCG
jgi:hypothetical protein